MFNVIYTLWLRQIKRYFRSKSRIIGSLAQPLLFLFALGYGLGPAISKSEGGNYLNFLVPGVIAMSILFTSMFQGIEIIWDKQFGFLKETLVTPTSRTYIMIGRTLGGATVASFQGLIVFFISLFIGFPLPSLLNFILALVIMFLVALFFTGVGTCIASLLDDMQGFQLIMNFLTMPCFFLSGAIFDVANSSHFIRVISYFDPLSYGVDGLRGVFLFQGHNSFLFNFGILSSLVLIVIAIGSYLFSKIEA